MNKSLAVVLPLHNADRTLRRDVRMVLDAVADLAQRVEVLLVDNGSTDDTFETATEMSVEYPQVRVVRRAQQAGMAEALSQLRAGIDADTVIVHDGASPINAEQLRTVWRQQQTMADASPAGVSFADLRRPAASQAAMEEAHRRIMGPRDATLVEEEEAPAVVEGVIERRDAASTGMPPRSPAVGVGAIPPLPAMKPSVLGALSDFALGE